MNRSIKVENAKTKLKPHQARKHPVRIWESAEGTRKGFTLSVGLNMPTQDLIC